MLDILSMTPNVNVNSVLWKCQQQQSYAQISHILYERVMLFIFSRIDFLAWKYYVSFKCDAFEEGMIWIEVLVFDPSVGQWTHMTADVFHCGAQLGCICMVWYEFWMAVNQKQSW